MPPDFPADKLMVVEVYTPSGNWSSYPPHKHDVHNPPSEVDLDEIYYYRMHRPEGYAHQPLYTRNGQRDLTLTLRDGDAVLVRDGYHPVVAGHGYKRLLPELPGRERSSACDYGRSRSRLGTFYVESSRPASPDGREAWNLIETGEIK